jgi:hypothetical protein
VVILSRMHADANGVQATEKKLRSLTLNCVRLDKPHSRRVVSSARRSNGPMRVYQNASRQRTMQPRRRKGDFIRPGGPSDPCRRRKPPVGGYLQFRPPASPRLWPPDPGGGERGMTGHRGLTSPARICRPSGPVSSPSSRINLMHACITPNACLNSSSAHEVGQTSAPNEISRRPSVLMTDSSSGPLSPIPRSLNRRKPQTDL